MDLQSTPSRSPDGGTGYLIVRVTTARGAIPLEDAQVDVRNEDMEFSDHAGDVLVSIRSGRDGDTPLIPLEAPLRTLSQSPGSTVPVYGRYQIEVRRTGYFDQSYLGVPIFDGITAIQTVDLIPLPENAAPDGFSEHLRSYTETPPNGL